MDLHQNIRTDSRTSSPWRKWADVWWGVSVPLYPHPEIQNCLGTTAACCYDIHNLEMERWIFLMASQFVQLFTAFSVLTSYYCRRLQLRAVSWLLLGKRLLSHQDGTDDLSVLGEDISQLLPLISVLNLAHFNFHSPTWNVYIIPFRKKILCFSYNSCFLWSHSRYNGYEPDIYEGAANHQREPIEKTSGTQDCHDYELYYLITSIKLYEDVSLDWHVCGFLYMLYCAGDSSIFNGKRYKPYYLKCFFSAISHVQYCYFEGFYNLRWVYRTYDSPWGTCISGENVKNRTWQKG